MLREEAVEALGVREEAVLARTTHEPGRANEDDDQTDETCKCKDGARKSFVLLISIFSRAEEKVG